MSPEDDAIQDVRDFCAKAWTEYREQAPMHEILRMSTLLPILLNRIDAQATQIETLQEILMNGPCERHSGKNTPPLHEFIELLQGKCILCMVEQIADLKDIAIKERVIVLDECGKPQDIENVLTGRIDELKMTAKRQLEAEYEAMR